MILQSLGQTPIQIAGTEIIPNPPPANTPPNTIPLTGTPGGPNPKPCAPTGGAPVPVNSGAPVPVNSGAPVGTTTGDPVSANVKITFYTSHSMPGDNDVAHPVNPAKRTKVGGVGTYEDPLTLASFCILDIDGGKRASCTGTGEYPWGALVYVPEVQKYFVHEDLCTGCVPRSQVDLYIGRPSDTPDADACAGKLTPNVNQNSKPIILNPGPAEKVSSIKIWDQTTGNGKCIFDNLPLPLAP
jgi:hypothetical protein